MTDIQAGNSTWTFADTSSRFWWSDLWAERVIRSALADQAISYQLSTLEELDAISSAWRRWGEHDDAFFVVVHAELIARR